MSEVPEYSIIFNVKRRLINENIRRVRRGIAMGMKKFCKRFANFVLFSSGLSVFFHPEAEPESGGNPREKTGIRSLQNTIQNTRDLPGRFVRLDDIAPCSQELGQFNGIKAKP